MTRKPSTPEERESQFPARDLLTRLGWEYVEPEELEAERGGIRDHVLKQRLERKVRQLNPWLSDDNVAAAVRAIMQVDADNLITVNQAAHDLMVFGFTVKQDRGEGLKSYTAKFFDYEDTSNNEYLCTMEYKVGAKNQGEAACKFDVICFINGIPICLVENKDPTRKDAVGLGIGDLHNYEKRSPRIFTTSEPLVSMEIGRASCRDRV